ncbi:MAG: hypothetical protein GWP62_04945 [Gammaproteobacteria bacterium]|jgi:hypothetical protein|nr:hypothetical protein [Gammaproteobacteria bacterium]
MQQTTLETKETQQGILATELCRKPQGDADLLEDTARILDKLIPLRDASHVDVVEYRVEIPMRYAECHAILADGTKVRFMDPRKFLGWSSHDVRRSLLFRNNDVTLEVEVDNRATERQCSTVRSISLQAAVRQGANRIKKFIGIDGDLLILPAM